VLDLHARLEAQVSANLHWYDLFRDPTHPTRRGHEVIGGIIAPELARVVLGTKRAAADL
jgi:phospholipase/lecithinase/hemolysin